ncbi:hypothetical protein DYU11_17705 [Fibrisoma montanum]|uniref:Uncharacterized protein n=1 Tax=Fibrisoma montanum TaxID=2305895 RepID=A0A418M671_9BACT|nr:hypothetical protein [Fibrisoma montanum]RIV21255.1 hypothetical protein DYU11_17705 [Fibrisoma montanum]
MNKDWFILSVEKISSLINYYIFLFFVGLVLSLTALLYESYFHCFRVTISLASIVGGFGTALVGSSIFYLRKIYKASINKEMRQPSNEDEKIRELGMYTYFYARPMFAIGFSLLIHISLKSGVNIVTVKETQLEIGFIYLSMFLSFFAGFASGDILTYIETKSSEWATKTFKNS